MLSSWSRAVRIRFLLASVIAVSTGLTLSYWRTGKFDPLDAALTYVGVVFLHASVDLLNDYWDHKRGIDNATSRTKYSGGTGVIPERLLSPKSVYRAGILFLILGAAIGTYFVVTKGIAVAIILGFAVVAIYFYSTSVVDAGLGELFVAVKGAMIVLGTFYVQTAAIDPAALLIGSVIGLLSATVLFVNAFPDYAADKSGGRRTLVIMLGKHKAAKIFPLFFIAAYSLIGVGIVLGYASIYSIACLASLPFALKASLQLRKGLDKNAFLPAMGSTVTYSRIAGSILAASFLF